MKRRILALFCAALCLWLLPCTARAASTTQATEPISLTKDCQLTVTYSHNGLCFPDMTVRLYKIASVSADYQYAYTKDFSACALPLNGVTSQREWDTLRATLESLILAGQPTPTATTRTDRHGQAVFSQLEPGLYFIPACYCRANGVRYTFSSVLVALPGLNEATGDWNYAVSAAPKSLSFSTTPHEIQYQLVKLWKHDTADTRPESITVELFCDGSSVTTVVLSADNQWTYTWTDDTDGIWTVVERSVPRGYTPSVEARDTSFVLTNTGSDSPTRTTTRSTASPYTGDDTPLGLYGMLLCISGLVLVILGLTGRRRAS